MKKTIKITLFICLFSLLCTAIFSACSLGVADDNFAVENPIDKLPTKTDTSSEVKEETPLEKEHKELIKRVDIISYDSTYSELYSLYSDILSHKEECGCSPNLSLLLNYMFLGEWKSSSGAIIRFTYIFDDYNDKNGVTALENNLKTSKQSGKAYYYYFDYRDNNLIVGYADVASGEKTDNFIISFEESSISLESLIENKEYKLLYNLDYQKVVKGKAKLAYEHIVGIIDTFENPEAIKITNCYVHYPNDHVYITIEYENDAGAKVTEQYEITIVDGEYQKKVFPYLASNNVKLDELNQLLKDYLEKTSNE